MRWRTLNRVVGGALLVSGTCIGAGMLGLPISTAASGFYPALTAFLFCWVMMTLTAFLMLEISLCYPAETNLITMARATLGKGGAAIAWVCYLFFLYALMGAYTSGASDILAQLFTYLGINEALSLPTFVLFFAFVVFLGAFWVDAVNRVMMIGLMIAYFSLVGISLPKVDSIALDFTQAKYLWMSGPLLVTSFGFHLLIPSLKNYMESDIKALRTSILLGSLIPLIVYLLWEYIILSAVPVEGGGGLIAMSQTKQPVLNLTRALSQAMDHQWVTLFARIFSFCAILTSFIGVSLGLFDFLSDGFSIQKSIRGKLLLAIMTFLPPLLFVLAYPAGFLMALSYAGVFAAILLVIYPAAMVWRNRQVNPDIPYRVIGGKSVLFCAFLFGVVVIVLELLQEVKWLPVPMQ